MGSSPTPDNGKTHHQQTWIHSRLLVEQEFFDVVREGIAMIAAGFGSFALFDGLTAGHGQDELPKVFALAITAVGIVVILLAAQHHGKTIAWIDADEYDSAPAPELPNERRLDYLAAGSVIIGLISFIALLRLP